MKVPFTESKKFKILTSPLKEDGCSWYRMETLMNTANELDIASCQQIKPDLDDDTIEKVFGVCDVFLYRFSSEGLVPVVRAFRDKHPEKVMVIDTDDDVYNISPINDAYRTFGTKEVNLPDGTPLWKHGKAMFDLYTNRSRILNYEYCLEQSDAVTTTTLRLANTLKEHNEAVGIIPNAIDFNRWPLLDVKKGKEIRLVWQGGASHYEDLYEIKDGLITLVNKYPQLKLVLVGQSFEGILKDIPKERYEYWPWVKSDGHSYRMCCTNADIGIAPLRDLSFNYAKSNVKWYEYSAMKIPTVASKVPPYSDEIVDGVNGLLFQGTDDFVKQVSLLIDDPLKRAEIGTNAYRWVKENRDVKKVAVDWVDFLKGLVEAKKKYYKDDNHRK